MSEERPETDESPPAVERGRFIVFEGLDGAGTTTQAERLAQWLRHQDLQVELTKEPSNGPVGAALRQAIEGRVTLDPVALSLAFASDRVDHLFNEYNGVEKMLAEGRWVVCDRYVLSSLAYQASDRVGHRWLLEINSYAIEPDMTIFLDADPEVCLDRIAARSSTTELFHHGDHLLIARRNYQQIEVEPRFLGRFVVVDANDAIEQVFENVCTAVTPLFAPRAEASADRS